MRNWRQKKNVQNTLFSLKLQVVRVQLQKKSDLDEVALAQVTAEVI